MLAVMGSKELGIDGLLDLIQNNQNTDSCRSISTQVNNIVLVSYSKSFVMLQSVSSYQVPCDRVQQVSSSQGPSGDGANSLAGNASPGDCLREGFVSQDEAYSKMIPMGSMTGFIYIFLCTISSLVLKKLEGRQAQAQISSRFVRTLIAHTAKLDGNFLSMYLGYTYLCS